MRMLAVIWSMLILSWIMMLFGHPIEGILLGWSAFVLNMLWVADLISRPWEDPK